MLRAVIMGSAQPRRSFLSMRRSIRRLRRANFWFMVAFTRNPSWLRISEIVEHSLIRRNRREISSFFHEFPVMTQETTLVQGLGDIDQELSETDPFHGRLSLLVEPQKE